MIMKKSRKFSNNAIALKDLQNSISSITVVVFIVFLIASFLLVLAPEIGMGGKIIFGIESDILKSSYTSEAKVTEYTTVFAKSEYEIFAFMILPFMASISQFAFLHQKESCYTVLSFPVKRRRIYLNRMLLPLVLILLITVIVKFIALNVNLEVIPNNAFVTKAWLIHMSVVLRLISASYTVGVASSILCGKTSEAVFAGASIVFLIPASIQFIMNVIKTTLYGYEYSQVLDDISVFAGPTAFYSASRISEYTFDFSYNDTIYQIVIPSVVWVVVSVALLIGFAFFFQKKYKPENSSMKGTNKAVLFICCFTAPIYVAYVINQIIHGRFYGTFTQKLGIIALIISVIGALVASIICSFTVNFSFRKIKTALLSGAGIGAVALVTLIICATGVFGTYNYVPEFAEIENMQISVPFDNTCRYSQGSSTSFLGSYGLNNGEMLHLTSEKDIEIARDIHKSLLENRGEDGAYRVDITYVLKNGKVVQRQYDYVSTETFEKLIKLGDTDYAKEQLKRNILPESFPNPLNQMLVVAYDRCEVTLSSQFEVNEDISDKLSPEQFDALRNAIYEDNKDKTAKERLMPESDYLGMLHFNIHLGLEDQSGFSNEFASVYIYGDMVNTLKVMEEAGIKDLLYAKNEAFTRAYIVDSTVYQEEATKHMGDGIMSKLPKPKCFTRSFALCNMRNVEDVKIITDPDEIFALMEKAKAQTLVTGESIPLVIFEAEGHQGITSYVYALG